MTALHLTLSLNLSARELVQPTLLDDVNQVLNAHGLTPRDLRLEITETVLIENQAEASEIIEQLRRRGFQLQMDDFGTGYSSLSYLHRFPVDVLKVDRQFVSRFESSEKNAEIIRTILTLARNLGKEVVAEGVETPAQLDFLRELGCTFAQGFLFAPPLEAKAAETYLHTHRPRLVTAVACGLASPL